MGSSMSFEAEGRADGHASSSDNTIRSRIGQIVDGPFVGMVPWIILGVFEGPDRTPWAVLVAFLFAIGFLVLDRIRGRSLKLLNMVSAVYFLILLITVNMVSDSAVEWLEIWLGEISN